MANQIYDLVTDAIIAKLEQGVIPWRKTWQGSSIPLSFATKKPYRGVNNFLLSMSGFRSPYWATFNQIKKSGGQVKAGEKGSTIVFWRWIEEKDDNGKKTGTIPFLRYFKVWNTDQTTGLNVPEFETVKPADFNPIAACEAVLNGMPMPPTITHGGEKAYYSPPLDIVNMPPANSFETPEAYYGTMFHELAHSTGHASRLNRDEVTKATSFGSMDYSAEELVAEMTAAMVCGQIGIGTELLDNQAAYIQGWLKKLKDDKKMLVRAGGKAQKAADYILNQKPDYSTEEES